MYINATGYYVPEARVGNDYFLEVNGKTDEWIRQRTGIVTRSKASDDENINTMALRAVEMAVKRLPYDIGDVDLIVAASYSPHDTVATPAHVIQNRYGIQGVKAVYVSSACSSFMNALEIVECYFKAGKATKALVIGGDKNTAYYHPEDPKSGHLWGDASAVFFLSKERMTESDARIVELTTEALGYHDNSVEAINMRPYAGGISMTNGKDVFIKACQTMPRNVRYLLENNGYTLDDLSYLVAHQANLRILNNVASDLKLRPEQVLQNIVELGNTGSASSALVYAENSHRFRRGDVIVMTVFGGGYSTGGCLIVA
ncbi:MAG: ketoacyl-ACP synthase III [Alistipes sp.]|nr:ketoacyl-ACP synthase III [Alistipes sp.]